MSNSQPRKLTEAFVRSLPVGHSRVVRDTKVTGLLVAVNKRSKSYKVQRDLWIGRRGQRTLLKTVRHTLGTTDDLTLDEARLKAEDVIRQIKRGIDPNAQATGPSSEGWTVGILFDEYAADLRAREKAPRTIEDTLARRDRYLHDWRNLQLTDMTRSMLRNKHQQLTLKHGKAIANHVMRDFRAAYNLALRISDEPDDLPDNPVKAVTFNKERRKGAVIHPDDLAAWWDKIQTLPNPLRRLMHELGLFSDLRPGTLVSLRREWINMENRAISIPTMKSGRCFDLPLSSRMIDIVGRALQLSDLLFPRSEWLFPTRATKDNLKRGIRKGDVIATHPGLAREVTTQRNRTPSASYVPNRRTAHLSRQD